MQIRSHAVFIWDVNVCCHPKAKVFDNSNAET